MDKVLAFSILSASPADLAVGGGWTRLPWRRSAEDDHHHAAEPENKPRRHKEEQGSRSRSKEEGCGGHCPRFAPEFDGIDCFETIVSH